MDPAGAALSTIPAQVGGSLARSVGAGLSGGIRNHNQEVSHAMTASPSLSRHAATLFAGVAALTLSSTAAQAEGVTIDPQAIRAHVTFLADDLMEGRDTGSRGFDIAANYVASRFLAMGLKPAGADGSFFQRVTVREARIAGTPTLALAMGAGAPVAVPAGQAIFRASLASKSVALDAPLVFAGFGFARPDLKLDDYRGLDVKGKIVVVLAGFPKGLNSELGAHLNATKAKMAMERGAVAVIVVPTRADMGRYTWERRREIADGPAKGWVQADGATFLTAPRIQTALTLHPDAAAPLFAAAGHPLAAILDTADKAGGRPKGFDLNARVQIGLNSDWSEVKSENVVAVLPGSDPALAGESVALTAHLDHIGVHGNGPDKLFNGAMDNAAGVATMLEAAHAIAGAAQHPRRTILFAAVTGEEGGLLGSDYLARNPLASAGTVVADVNFDMPILTYRFADVIAFGAEHSTMGPIVAAAAQKEGIALSPDPLPEEGLFTRSDHYRFVQQGVPSVFMVPGFAGPGEAAFKGFLKTHYHQPSDDLKLPFDWEAGALFARVNTRIVQDLADAPERPRWYAGDFFGGEFAKDAPKAAAKPVPLARP